MNDRFFEVGLMVDCLEGEIFFILKLNFFRNIIAWTNNIKIQKMTIGHVFYFLVNFNYFINNNSD